MLLSFLSNKNTNTKKQKQKQKPRIEEGRYKKIAQNDRICPLCKTGIEDEKHFVIHCTQLKDPRFKLYSKLNDIFPDFHSLNDELKFQLIMSNNDTDVITTLVLEISSIMKGWK